jgi:hypothetical protein
VGWVVNATPRPLYLRKRPSTHCTGGWVRARAGLDGCGKSRHQWDSIPGPSSPVSSRYTDWANPAHLRADSVFCCWGSIKPPYKGCLLLKWYKVLRMAEEVQTLGELGKMLLYTTLSRLIDIGLRLPRCFFRSYLKHKIVCTFLIPFFVLHISPNLSSDGSRYSSVGIATRYWLDGPEIQSRFERDIPHRTHRPWDPPSLLYNTYRVSFPGVKRPGRGVAHAP